MAWSVVSGAIKVTTTGTGGTSWDVGNLGAALSAGDRMVAVITFYNTTATISSISDSLNNTWVLLTRGNSNYVAQEIWSAVSADGTPSSITVTPSASVGVSAIAIASYRGLDTAASTGCLDGTPLRASATSNSSPDSGTTAGTTASASGLKVGAYSDNGSYRTITAGTSDASYTLNASNSPTNYATAAIESVDSGAAGSTARATFSSTGTADWQTTVFVIKLAVAASGPSIPILMNQYRQRRN